MDTLSPEVRSYFMTRHAAEQMMEREFRRVDIYRTIAEPEVTYQQGDREANRRVCQRGDLAVVVEDDTRTIVTVLWRDQTRYDGG